MSPRWSRVFGQICNLRRSTEFARRDLSVFEFRNYAKVSAAVEPNAECDTIKPEVNHNKLFWSKPRSLALATDSPYRIEDPQYEGIKRFVLKMMLFYSKQSQFIRWANVIYGRVVYQVDRPAIYDVFSLEKTFKTTFSLLVLHMWLCLRRLKEEGKEGVELGQYLYEIYNHDLELRVSKAGVNLLLSKWMKELEKIFYGNIVAYDAAIGKQDDLENVIWRNVFSDDGTSKPSDGALLPVQAMTRYIRREASCLSLTDKEAILSGNFMFTPLEDTGPDLPRK
ncbi:ubiquinol-cytochrome-c reductase complex assembly factor 1 [Sesamum indicum]|uniref:Ubiquinol-cytochrome-c reductase complex assembly factor 1 n=1 Tax=Sesamum indicum TaxID=4182 RepID=A0A6I9T8L9_SESIN|nr:ubiquinol-cytochrome-c reductase complex assembly factor 1 [Sesamum indicum]